MHKLEHCKYLRRTLHNLYTDAHNMQSVASIAGEPKGKRTINQNKQGTRKFVRAAYKDRDMSKSKVTIFAVSYPVTSI